MALPTLIYCAGGNPMFRRIAAAEGWFNGARLPDSVYEPPLYFADHDYHRPDIDTYLTAVDKHRPEMATCLDWEREEQRTHVWNWAFYLSHLVSTIVMIPKIPGTVDEIPAFIEGVPVRLGFSVPTFYGGTGIPLWEFGRRPVHLLGGSPHKQRELASYLNVVSLDQSMMQQQAFQSRFWSPRCGPKGHWHQFPGAGAAACFQRSCQNIRRAWEKFCPAPAGDRD
jgi:hypothetical protein